MVGVAMRDYNKLYEKEKREYVEAEYDKLYERAEELHGDDPEPLALDPDFPYEIKKLVVYFGHPDTFPWDLITANDMEKARVRKKVEDAVAVLNRYAPHYLNSFLEPYSPSTEKQADVKYRKEFIRNLVKSGLSERRSQKILKLLRSL